MEKVTIAGMVAEDEEKSQEIWLTQLVVWKEGAYVCVCFIFLLFQGDDWFGVKRDEWSQMS